MKQSFSLNQVFLVALLAGALIGVATAASDYQGQVDFSLGPKGFQLRMNGGDRK